MELTVLLATLTMFWKLPTQVSAKVRCYQCEPNVLDTGVKKNLCQYFDGSELYKTDCLHSTMCFKKEVSLDFGNGVKTTGIRRGCAPQLLKDEQEKNEGHWHYVFNIHEAYEDKCSEVIDPDRPTKTTYCYCRGDLCNGGSKKTVQIGVMSGMLCLVAIFNALS